MARYVLRFFFDGCSGDCLWSDNDAAIERYGYPASLNDLGVSEKTISKADEIMRTACRMAHTDPDVYGVHYEFSAEEKATHRIEIDELLSIIRSELGADYEVTEQY